MLSCPAKPYRSHGATPKATGARPGPTRFVWYPFPVVLASEPTVVNGRRYLRAPVSVHFPVQDVVPETGVHYELRTALFLLLRGEFTDRAFVGSDQFLYWDPADPQACVAPDVMVRLGAPDAPVPCWKVWEGGAPHVAVEIVSSSDASDRNWSLKLERYLRSGVQEVVRFDPEDDTRALRLWDRVEGDLVERDLTGARCHPSDALGLYWLVTPDARLGQRLRLARDANGSVLLPTHEERIAELEAELRKR